MKRGLYGTKLSASQGLIVRRRRGNAATEKRDRVARMVLGHGAGGGVSGRGPSVVGLSLAPPGME